MRFRKGKAYRDAAGGGRWVAVYYVDGQRQRERTQCTDEADLEGCYAKIEERVRAASSRGRDPDPKRELGQTVTKFLEANTALAKPTREQYRGILGNFVAFTGARRKLVSLEAADVVRFLEEHRSTGVRPATVAADRRVVRAFSSWCERLGYVGASFGKEVKPIRVPKVRKRYLRRQQVVAFLNACSPAFWPIAVLTILCGFRRKEIVNLKWNDVNLDEGLIHFVRAKTDDEQEIPLHPFAVEVLRSVERISEWVFPITEDHVMKDGQIVRRGDKRSETTGWFLEKTKQAAAAIGMQPEELDFHGLRKTFACLVQGTGHDIRMTGQLLGHGPGSKGAVTDLYVFDDEERQRAAVDAIRVDGIVRPLKKIATKLPQTLPRNQEVKLSG